MRIEQRVIGYIAVVVALSACGDSGSSGPASPPTYSITGTIAGAAGVSIRVSDAETDRSAVTGSDGSFAVSGLRPGTYTVAPTQPGFLFTPVTTTVTVSASDAVSGPITRRPAEEGLSAVDAARIDAQAETPVSLDAVILPNGQSVAAYTQSRGITPAGMVSTSQSKVVSAETTAAIPVAIGPQQKKNDIIAQMVLSAHDYACGRNPIPCTKWNYPADPTGTIANPKPAHNGLTYIWGGKFVNESSRSLPSDGCPELTFGMDCSGLISKIAGKAGITAPAGSTNQGDPEKWIFPADWKLKFKRITDGSFQTGDLVAWDGHIGIAARDGRTDVPVISSTGIPGECKKNIAAPRGPRTLTVAQLGLGAPRSVLRLVTTLSGEWDMYIRCTDQATDAAKIRFTINNDQGGAFTATGSGIDYNGLALSFVLEGTYNQNSNTVSAILSLTDGSRSDSFTATLLEDDTGYITLTRVVNNGGCIGAVRLVRVQTSPDRSDVRAPRIAQPDLPASSVFGRPRRR